MDLVSTAQLLGNFGEFFGSIAVVVTLIFLTFQMRQNATETRNSSIQSIMSSEANGRYAMLNSDVPSILVRLRAGDPLSVEDEIRFDTFMHGVFHDYETAFHAWRTGTVPSEVMDAMDERIRVWIDVPGWEQRWRYAARLHTESFRKHVDELAGR